MMKNYILFLFCILIFTCKNKPNLKIEKNHIAELEYEIPSLLGEGAIWNYKTDEFYWVDIEGKKFNIYNPSSKVNKAFVMPSRIGTVVPFTDKEVVVALEDGVYAYNFITDSINRISDVEANLDYNRFNDGKCDPLGNLWVGSMHLEQSEPKANLYKVNEYGDAEIMVDSVTISNGIVWTKDAKTMYYIDTPTSEIRAYDYNVEDGSISNERVAVKVDLADGFPDGMTIDEDDMLWVGMWNGNAVVRYNPKTGELMSKIEVPAHNVTSCAFGGEQLDILFITTSSLDMSDEEKRHYPLAGSIFSVTPGVKGVKASFFGRK